MANVCGRCHRPMSSHDDHACSIPRSVDNNKTSFSLLQKSLPWSVETISVIFAGQHAKPVSTTGFGSASSKWGQYGDGYGHYGTQYGTPAVIVV